MDAVFQPHGGQFLRGPVERIFHARQFQRGRDVFKRRHRRYEVERLEHDAHMLPAEAGEGVFAKRGEVVAQRGDVPAGCAFEPAEQHEERRLA